MSAILSADGVYRYTLSREWDMFNRFRICWIMLNPSTADAEKDDATIRRCIGFSKRWGFGGLVVVNLYAYRTTYPQILWTIPEAAAIGPENETHVYLALENCDRAIAAWGAVKPPEPIAKILRKTHRNIEAFQPLTAGGFPPHPVRLAYSRPTDSYEVPR